MEDSRTGLAVDVCADDGRPELARRGAVGIPAGPVEVGWRLQLVQTLGYRLLAPAAMTLTTEVMPTWRALWRQRLRWKRGAVENCAQYGLTAVTWRYWGRQLLTAAGVVVTTVYLTTLLMAITSGQLVLHPLWASITAVFCLERSVTLKDKGWRHQLAAALMYELPYELLLQAAHAKAYADALLRRERQW